MYKCRYIIEVKYELSDVINNLIYIFTQHSSYTDTDVLKLAKYCDISQIYVPINNTVL